MYAVLSRYGKPMIIPECGVQALPSQAAWVAGLGATAKQFPLLRAVIYFNAVDPYPWVNGQKPDWRIDPALWPPASGTGETTSPLVFFVPPFFTGCWFFLLRPPQLQQVGRFVPPRRINIHLSIGPLKQRVLFS
jgi:hypothetical protein